MLSHQWSQPYHLRNDYYGIRSRTFNVYSMLKKFSSGHLFGFIQELVIFQLSFIFNFGQISLTWMISDKNLTEMG